MTKRFHLHQPRVLAAAVLLALTALGAAYALQPSAPARPDSSQPVSYRKISWDELVPKEWDPLKKYRDMNLGAMEDNDPRAQQMLHDMQEAWNNAPTNGSLQDQAVRLPGFVVPLEVTKAGMREFLLVPYFGACVHVPPPPSNQIVHVKLKQPAKIEMMDTVWVSGRMRLVRSTTDMGTSGYMIEGVEVQPYTEQPGK